MNVKVSRVTIYTVVFAVLFAVYFLFATPHVHEFHGSFTGHVHPMGIVPHSH